MLMIEVLTLPEDVFDITVEGNHNFFADGILVHNCVEISLRPFQFCNLTETNVSNVVSQLDLEERVSAAAFIGTLQAAYTNFHYLRPIWKETTEKDALIGVSMTGIASGCLDSLDLAKSSELVKQVNRETATTIGINPAARTTCVKPAGSTSLVLGTSSGIHAWHAPYYIRRMRVGKNEALYAYIKESLPELIEDCQFKPHIEAVMSFPQKAPKGAVTRFEDVMDFLNRVKRYNLEWVAPGHVDGDNKHNVSCTVSIKDDEWKKVGDWMWAERESYTGISVLPYNGGTYIQAPFEDCTEEKFNEMVGLLRSVDLTKVIELDDVTSHTKGSVACAGGVCEII